MNRQSAGNQIIETYKQVGSIIETAKALKLPYKEVQKTLYKSTEYISNKKKPVKISSYDKNYFKVIDRPDKAYFLGLLKADGYVDKTRFRVALRLQEKDKELLEKFCDVLGFPHSRINTIKPRYEGQNCHAEIAITNTELVSDLLDVKTSKILTKVPEEFARDFIRGYFDGDGTIAYRNLRKLYFSLAVMGSPSDDHFLKYIMERVPGFTKIYVDKRSDLPFIKSDNHKVLLAFWEYVYRDTTLYLNRKKNKFDYFKLLFDTSTTKRKTSQEDEDIV